MVPKSINFYFMKIYKNWKFGGFILNKPAALDRLRDFISSTILLWLYLIIGNGTFSTVDVVEDVSKYTKLNGWIINRRSMKYHLESIFTTHSNL
jgi:hypothetical protein